MELVVGGGETPAAVTLHNGTAWSGPLRVSPTASEDTTDLADDMDWILAAMIGTAPARSTTPTGPGIVLGTYAEFPSDSAGLTTDYSIRSKAGRVLILGRDDVCTARACYRFLALLGYRQLMPTATWEVIPPRTTIVVKVSVSESNPLQFLHALGSSGGIGSTSETRLDGWQLTNRIPIGPYRFNHTYGQILADNPGYPASWVGSNNKLCVLEPGLQAATLEWVLGELASKPDTIVQSLAAADGTTGYDAVCSGTNEQATYSPSDRQVLLANYVQDEIGDAARIGILAYGAMSPAPTVAIDPRLVIAITDGYYEGAETWDSVDAGYRGKGAVDTIPYAYTSVFSSNLAQPGQGRACDLGKMTLDAERARKSSGLRGLLAEGASSWGVHGLGYWVLARLCIDGGTAAEHRQAFLSAAFEGQSAVMGAWYDIVSTPAPLSSDQVHRLYQGLSDALAGGPSAAVQARIRDLAVYVRYVELLLRFTEDDDLASFDAMIAWMWRSRERDLVPVRASYSQPAAWQPWFDEVSALYSLGPLTFFSDKPTAGPWATSDDPFLDAEIDAIIADGIANNALLPFTPVGYSSDLVPHDLGPDNRARGSFIYSNRDHQFLLYIAPGQSQWEVEVRGGWADNGGPSYLHVYELSGALLGTVTAQVDVTSDEVLELQPGTYRVQVEANSGVHWSCPGYATTRLTDLGFAPYVGDFSGYFMVPAGLTEIGGYAGALTRIRDPAGVLVHTVAVTGYFVFVVVASEVDRIYRIENANGRTALMTVPPGLSVHPTELLVPAQ